MKTLEVTRFGPIKGGCVSFGDLTVLVGPQASGKSLFVQLFKLIEDLDSIRKTLMEHGFDWSKADDFLDLYFGEGMKSIWNHFHHNTQVFADDFTWDLPGGFEIAAHKVPGAKESVFLIPAQRVLVLQDGWPSPLSRSIAAPYCMRMFSETLRRLLEQKLGKGNLSSRSLDD